MSADSLVTFNLADLAGREVSSERVVQLLFQTGYLTLDSLLEMGSLRSFSLCFPNAEVRFSFGVGLLTTYERIAEPDTYAFKLVKAAMSGDTEQHLYIIEFQMDKTAMEAVRQIDMQKYAEKYLHPAQAKGQTVHALGINFSHEAGIRNITDWREEILTERDV